MIRLQMHSTGETIKPWLNHMTNLQILQLWSYMYVPLSFFPPTVHSSSTLEWKNRDRMLRLQTLFYMRDYKTFTWLPNFILFYFLPLTVHNSSTLEWKNQDPMSRLQTLSICDIIKLVYNFVTLFYFILFFAINSSQFKHTRMKEPGSNVEITNPIYMREYKTMVL